ncbi:hypothetical protein DSO57_1012101 [Entomophthora muscae]|uniref:Uncharacterized protein n=1 Tax=Entomophthora muscae TaxID=34485 RepID=A0ACC2SJ17_9FUNG|nr:hypothetical protein DSO57_1012101 [Entomophthora muscae]
MLQYFQKVGSLGMLSKLKPSAAVSSHYKASPKENVRHKSLLEPNNKMEPLPFLEYPNVTINNPKAVLEKITKINKDGAEALHIITDFDMTLTKHWVNGKRNFSSHSALQASNAVSDDFVKQAKEIFAKYYPLEIDPTIPHNEKVKHMVDFWEESHGIFIKEKLSADLIRAALKDFKIVYREGTHHFMDVTGKKNIPVLVFSAGVGGRKCFGLC